jgi:hypothetical protein
MASAFFFERVICAVAGAVSPPIEVHTNHFDSPPPISGYFPDQIHESYSPTEFKRVSQPREVFPHVHPFVILKHIDVSLDHFDIPHPRLDHGRHGVTQKVVILSQQIPVLHEGVIFSRQAERHHYVTAMNHVQEAQQRVEQASLSWYQTTGTITHSAEVFSQINPSQLLEIKVQKDLIQAVAEEATDALLAKIGPRINRLNKQERNQAATLDLTSLGKLGISEMSFQTGGMKNLRKLALSLSGLYDNHNISVEDMTMEATRLLASFTMSEKRVQQLNQFGLLALLIAVVAKNTRIDKRRFHILAATLVAAAIMAGCGPDKPFPETVEVVPKATAAQSQTPDLEEKGESPEVPVAPTEAPQLTKPAIPTESESQPEMDGGPEGYYTESGGSLRFWNDKQKRYEAVRVEKADMSGTREVVKADNLLPLADGNMAAVADGKITAKVFLKERIVEAANNGKVNQGDGWFVAFDDNEGKLVDAVQIEKGRLIQWYWDRFQLVLDGDNAQIEADEIKAAGENLGWIVLHNEILKAFIDKEGRVLPAIDQRVLVGIQVREWDGVKLVDTDMSPMEHLISLAGNETITSTGVGLEISIVVAKKALGMDISMKFAAENRLRQFWLEMALDRMKDDGNVDRTMTFSQFQQWLADGDHITLKELDAFDAMTGKPKLYKQIDVKRIVVVNTHMDLKSLGLPELPVEGGKTRYAPSMHFNPTYDVVYDKVKKVMYIIVDGNGEYWALAKSERALNSILNWGMYNAAILVRVPHGNLVKSRSGLSRSGRVYHSLHHSRSGGEIFDRLILPAFPLVAKLQP